MKFIKVGNGHYINAALVNELYIRKCDYVDGKTEYLVVADVDDDQYYIDSYEKRADAERALENLIRSLEE